MKYKVLFNYKRKSCRSDTCRNLYSEENETQKPLSFKSGEPQSGNCEKGKFKLPIITSRLRGTFFWWKIYTHSQSGRCKTTIIIKVVSLRFSVGSLYFGSGHCCEQKKSDSLGIRNVKVYPKLVIGGLWPVMIGFTHLAKRVTNQKAWVIFLEQYYKCFLKGLNCFLWGIMGRGWTFVIF